MRKHNLNNVRKNIKIVLKTSKEENIKNIPISELLKLNHTLLWRVMATHVNLLVTEDEPLINFIEPFWEMCEEYEIYLSQEEKEDIVTHFLDD